MSRKAFASTDHSGNMIDTDLLTVQRGHAIRVRSDPGSLKQL